MDRYRGSSAQDAREFLRSVSLMSPAEYAELNKAHQYGREVPGMARRLRNLTLDRVDLVGDPANQPARAKMVCEGGVCRCEKVAKSFTFGVKDAPGAIRKSGSLDRLVFGWANVSQTADGKLVIDAHGDYILPEDLEKAAYHHMEVYASSGADHLGEAVGTVVESMVFTPQKLQALGMPPGSAPTGWWIGVKVHDDATWRRVQSGELRAFSVQGMAEV